jgi:hypothetical protein
MNGDFGQLNAMVYARPATLAGRLLPNAFVACTMPIV